MASVLRIGILETAATDRLFAEAFSDVPGTRVVGTFASWAKIQEALCFGSLDAVAVCLVGTDGESGLQTIRRIAEVAPAVGIIGVGSASDPEMIINAMRAGCSQFVRWPVERDDLLDAVERIRAVRLPSGSPSKRIAVIGSSGGAGATTIACNLALELAHLTERKIALVDMNLEFGDVACAFDCKPKYSISDVCRDGVEIDRMVIETAINELPCNVALLTRPEKVEDARELMPDNIEQMLRVLEQMFPYVVCDLPRSLNLATGAVLSDVDRLLIVLQLSVPFIRNATRIYDALLSAGIAEDRVEFVVNRYSANFERITTEEVERHFNRPIFALIPNDYRRVVASRDLGHSLAADAPKSPARRAIQQMARRIIDHAAEPVEEPDEGGLMGLFGKRRPK
ncbi:MAG: hypothetical protein CHACPFDD_03459 [Phycisphaerae bacterium]|nr:hypothetical protein [Phycisphaerae bacterium]